MPGFSDPTSAKRDKNNNNVTFIIVRPPPSLTNHPLNLQAQLVLPGAKRPRRSSIDSNAATSQIITPNTADAQTIYSPSSRFTASAVSVNSTTTTASGRRMLPVYTLQAHNVLPNVIVDTTTDAKIARFHKRGMELIGLAILEPTEVYAAGGDPSAAMIAQSRSRSRDIDHTPHASRTSLAGAGDAAEEGVSQAAAAPSSSMKGVWNRFFRKKNNKTDGYSKPSPAAISKVDRTPPVPRRSSLQLTAGGVPGERTPVLMPAVLGIQPCLSATSLPALGQRPAAYVWTVRRWLKGTPHSLLGSVFAGVLGTTAPGTPAEVAAHVELRLEWRVRVRAGGRGRAGTAGGGASSDAASRVSLASGAANQDALDFGTGRDEGVVDTEPTIRARPRAPSTPSLQAAADGDDDGDGGDSESSDTPWTCTLVARRVVPGASASAPVLLDAPATPGSQEGTVRIKVGTLAPTPHHPKVVAALKVPQLLPDVEVDAIRLRQRAVTPSGVGHAAGGDAGGLVLTGEEIKDLVGSTALWLICREKIGGVGLVTRKGDGWRIRS